MYIYLSWAYTKTVKVDCRNNIFFVSPLSIDSFSAFTIAITPRFIPLFILFVIIQVVFKVRSPSYRAPLVSHRIATHAWLILFCYFSYNTTIQTFPIKKYHLRELKTDCFSWWKTLFSFLPTNFNYAI